jgi:glyoxylase-like metal-dependent hydrolase (beta-lactamase superfamily II)
MIVESAAAPPFLKNGFVLGCEQSREAVLIDPGDEVDELLAAVARHQLSVVGILLTHAHVDHVSGVARAKRATAAPIWLHPDDVFLYDTAVSHGLLFGLRVEAPPPVDKYYEPGVAVPFGGYEAVPHHTPGHCPGGVCLQVGRRGERGMDLFVGDTLFAGSIGRTDLPGGDFDTLMRSIVGVLLPFGDEARVFPGHGPDTTIGHERQTNPFLTPPPGSGLAR